MTTIITLTNQKKIQNSILISPHDNKLLWPEPILIFCQSRGWGLINSDMISHFLFSLDKNTVPSPQMSRHTQSALFCLRFFLFCKSLANKTKVFPIICIIVSTQLIQFSAGTKRLAPHSQTPAESGCEASWRISSGGQRPSANSGSASMSRDSIKWSAGVAQLGRIYLAFVTLYQTDGQSLEYNIVTKYNRL